VPLDESFKDFVLDQLGALDGVRAKRMFGGFGLYAHLRQGSSGQAGEVFFGIVSNDTLYLKTDERTRVRYVEAGMKPFQPSPKQTLKNYYEAPADVLENPEALLEWASEAIEVAAP